MWYRRGLLPVGLAIVVVLVVALQQPPAELRLTQPLLVGDGWLIEVPGRAPLVIDGGTDGTALAVALGARLPFWQRSLSALILTRADYGLTAQLALSARYRVGTALLPAQLPAAERSVLLAQLAQGGATVQTATPGTRLQVGALQLTVLSAAAGRDGGMVLMIEYGRRRLVLHNGGPAGDAALIAVAEQLAPLDVLFFPWQRPGDHAVIGALQPRAVVYTVSWHDRRPVLQSYAERAAGGRRLFHPALDGTLTLLSDGVRLRVETAQQ